MDRCSTATQWNAITIDRSLHCDRRQQASPNPADIAMAHRHDAALSYNCDLRSDFSSRKSMKNVLFKLPSGEPRVADPISRF
jgi:hypothetical protein